MVFTIYKKFSFSSSVVQMGAVFPLAQPAVSTGFPKKPTQSRECRHPEPLVAEALCGLKHSAGENLSLFDFRPGQYECSMGTIPVTGLITQQQLPTPPLNSAAA